MTVIINSVWGGRITQTVDRQISRSRVHTEVVDRFSTKVCVVLCGDALVSMAYTGTAVAHRQWMDAVIAECLAHRPLASAMIQSGSAMLGRPLHVIVRELGLNLNSRINSDINSRGERLHISIVGWHLGRNPRPLAWELFRGRVQPDGRRYFELTRHPLGKFLRQNPRGFWAETLGDPGRTVDDGVAAIAREIGMTHDDVERSIQRAIITRATETETVSAECLSVQLDARDASGHIQFTRYPDSVQQNDEMKFVSAWVLTPTLICSPGTESTYGSQYSSCGRYLLGGFSDGQSNLHIRTRLPLNMAQFGGPAVLAYSTQNRVPTP